MLSGNEIVRPLPNKLFFNLSLLSIQTWCEALFDVSLFLVFDHLHLGFEIELSWCAIIGILYNRQFYGMRLSRERLGRGHMHLTLKHFN